MIRSAKLLLGAIMSYFHVIFGEFCSGRLTVDMMVTMLRSFSEYLCPGGNRLASCNVGSSLFNFKRLAVLKSQET